MDLSAHRQYFQIWLIYPAYIRTDNSGACSIDRLQRILGFLNCIRDSLELAADEHDDSLGSRLWVCDYMRTEIVMIFGTLHDIGAAIGPEIGNSTATA